MEAEKQPQLIDHLRYLFIFIIGYWIFAQIFHVRFDPSFVILYALVRYFVIPAIQKRKRAR